MTDKITRLKIECPHCDKEFTYLHRVGIAEASEDVEEIPEIEDDTDDGD